MLLLFLINRITSTQGPETFQGTCLTQTDQHQSDVTFSYRIQFSFAVVRNMSLKLRGNKVKPRIPLQLSHTHTYTETLIAWKIRNFGGDFWSDGVEEIGL